MSEARPARHDHRLDRLLPVPRWPTRDEAAAGRWFRPVRIGPLEARERTWVPAMVPWRATEGGEVTEAVLAWYGRFGRGRPGVLVVEATGIRDVPSGPLLRIGHDRFVPGLRRLVEAVREASEGQTKLFIQIIDFLSIKRRPEPGAFFRRFLKLDAATRERLARAEGEPGLVDAPEGEVRERLAALPPERRAEVLSARDLESLEMGYRERVTDLDLEHVRELPQTLPGLFAAAAARAREAGFDGVELHYAHAYTMASFLSARNRRDDGYGGPREARARLPLEVYRAVRRRAGDDYVVGVRFLGDEAIEGGSGPDDAAYFGAEFARAGFDFLSVSKGGKFEDAKQPKVGAAAYPYTGPSGHECMPTVSIDERGPFSRNVPLAAAVRRAVRAAGLETPVVAAGGIATFAQAEEVLARGEA
ncbi:MAG TPA: NADH:flavin oxidoreductase, partial [Polyangiaceae bacterium]|nr:NADH:flavin oxidoreductase [Polyangiaceae bacterium]